MEKSREERLAALVAAYETPLLHTCYMLLKDRGLAEDAAQETFIKAYRALDGFRKESSEKTWLMRIAVNTCRDMQRSGWSRYVDRRVQPEELPLPVWEPTFRLADELTQQTLRLPIKQREAILLHYFQDMTMTEIAKALGVSTQTVSRRIKQGCAKLKTMLEKEGLYE